MTITAPIRWGIIGPGAIAKDFRRGVLDSKLGSQVSRKAATCW